MLSHESNSFSSADIQKFAQSVGDFVQHSHPEVQNIAHALLDLIMEFDSVQVILHVASGREGKSTTQGVTESDVVALGLRHSLAFAAANLPTCVNSCRPPPHVRRVLDISSPWRAKSSSQRRIKTGASPSAPPARPSVRPVHSPAPCCTLACSPGRLRLPVSLPAFTPPCVGLLWLRLPRPSPPPPLPPPPVRRLPLGFLNPPPTPPHPLPLCFPQPAFCRLHSPTHPLGLRSWRRRS
jgi:hypothetical protein